MSKTSSQAITCKAVVCWGEGEPLKIEEIQVEPPKSTEVRVKMLYASLCHTDILCCKAFPGPLFPRVLGHEGVGVVESVGDEVKEVKEGDVVIPTYVGECEECENCRSGRSNLCLKHPLTLHGLMLDNTSRMSIRGQDLYHLFSCSTWSEYMVIDVNYVIKIDDQNNIPLSHASFLSCGFSTGFGGAWKEFNVERGSTVAVFGLGAVGLGAISGARIQGADKIIGIDKNPFKKDKGEAFGMTDFINPEESKDKSASELVKEITGGTGVDYSFECSGVPSLLSEALEATKLGIGKALSIGVGNNASVPVSVLSLCCGRTLKGTVFGGIKPKSDLPILLQKCKNKEFELDELLTHQVELEDTNRAIELLKQQDCVKVLIKISSID
ncbi:Alcohol dehydrogenase-like [Melia azedarach]|uniref:Alcohol dehydrogenase-like n=1 Tax=Melia azedarach TaxID=155640 RepID=A0ACC1YBX8_MELAZ|nr:Alcohol dehydrogenase-like [Melia azedarach]